MAVIKAISLIENPFPVNQSCIEKYIRPWGIACNKYKIHKYVLLYFCIIGKANIILFANDYYFLDLLLSEKFLFLFLVQNLRHMGL